MADMMTFPDTVEEFMEEYKIVDTEQVYTNGTEMVPIFRMMQWFRHEPERKKGVWVHRREVCREYIGIIPMIVQYSYWECSVCGYRNRTKNEPIWKFCPNCGADMRGKEQ